MEPNSKWVRIFITKTILLRTSSGYIKVFGGWVISSNFPEFLCKTMKRLFPSKPILVLLTFDHFIFKSSEKITF